MQIHTISRGRSRLSGDDATILASYGARTTWPSNFQIYQHGTTADGLSVVLRGQVILRNKARNGRAFIPAVIISGETFGIEGLCRVPIYITDAHASDETETLFIAGSQFRAFVRENPSQALNIIGQLMAERAALLGKLHSMASQNVEQRLIASLRRLASDRSFMGDDGTLRLEVKHHRLLCEMVGATRESIALALARLEGSGVAERKGMTFLIAPNMLADHISSNSLESDGALAVHGDSLRPQPTG